MEGAGWGADGVGVEAEGGVWCGGCGCGRERGGVKEEGWRAVVRELAVWMELEIEMKLGRVGAEEREFCVSGCVCGIDMADEDGRVGAVIRARGAAVRPGDERSGGSGQERWLAVPDALEVW